ncbi:MAG TPA: DinB family protein [Thermoanaerobaculia bacterium]|jgi:hypothetical protein
MHSIARCLFTLALVAVPLTASAAALQQTPKQAAPLTAAPTSGYRAEFLANLDELEHKYLDLATKVPVKLYTWRSSKEVRSFSEVFGHVAASTYFMANLLGTPPPDDMPKDPEKITNKQVIVAELRRSFKHVRETVVRMTDAELEKGTRLAGKPATQRAVLTAHLTHLHEHLGQVIAYARMNHIAPPWSM